MAIATALPTRRGVFQDTTRRRMLHAGLRAFSDVSALYIGLLIAYQIRTTNPRPFEHPTSFERFAVLAAALSPLWVMVFAALGLYTTRQGRAASTEVRIVAGTAFVPMALVFVGYLFPSFDVFPARSVPVFGFLIGLTLIALFRGLIRWGKKVIYARGLALHRVVMLGTDELAQRLAVEMSRRGSGYDIVAAVSPEEDGGLLLGRIPVYRDFDTAVAALDSVDEIVQADMTLHRAEIARMMSWATNRGITYRFVPDQFGVYAASSRMETVDGVPVMEVRLTSLEGWSAFSKRAFDLTVALATIAALLPVYATLALLIKLRDPSGPVLYRHARVGRRGKVIYVTKFRSMLWQYSTGPGRVFTTACQAFEAMGRPDLVAEFRRDQKVADDPRITGIGRFLRRTSLDELPQLFDVVRGDLSLIGPRPITTEELDRYGLRQQSLLALKPGVTGLWQVSGRSEVSYDERVKLDVFYIENWSLRLDARILAKTPLAVLSRRGAA